jgi:hypothetical protein
MRDHMFFRTHVGLQRRCANSATGGDFFRALGLQSASENQISQSLVTYTYRDLCTCRSIVSSSYRRKKRDVGVSKSPRQRTQVVVIVALCGVTRVY